MTRPQWRRDPDPWIVFGLLATSATATAIGIAWLLDENVPPILIALTAIILGVTVTAIILEGDDR